ncbi:hypothetical protein HRK28_04605 [Rathayibacter sp. VKM Ac-2835]|uniref:hypothetical protein n=1 Tax=Rathayibacter sp. VKM Ac-2835 TaxID=2739043 RepID=UPI001563B641|nr:hypothetical protein [Rathayibacter sp. VKM Ac-2835]NRG40195.1 hypothetical protein [Rathayibacter sp. VKM Ac-2835]
MTDDNDKTIFWEGSDGTIATMPAEQFQKDATHLFDLLITPGGNSNAKVGREVRRIFSDTSGDYLTAVATTVAGTFAGYSLTHPNAFQVATALINYGSFLTAFRALVPPAPYPTTTINSKEETE